MLRTLRTVLLLLASSLLLAVVACGGGDGDGEQVAAGEVKLASPDQLTSFRYEMVMEISGSSGSNGGGLSLDIEFVIDLSGTVIAPDREQSTIKADLGFFKIEIETIRIGDQAWSREPDGEWEVASTGSDVLPLDLSISPLDILGGSDFSALQALLAGLSGSTESVNGVDAVRYDLTAEQFAQAFPDEGGGEEDLTGDLEDMTVALWVARDSGILVRLTLEGTTNGDDGAGTVKIELNLTDLNSSSITIEPPI